MRRFIVFSLVLIVLVGLSGGLYYFQFMFKPVMLRSIISKIVPPPTSVAVEPARAEKWAEHIDAIGSFNAVQGINIAAQVGGIVTATEVKSGSDVVQGAPLVSLDDSTEQADLKSDLAALKNANLTFVRQQQLAATGNGAKINYDSAVAARDQAQAVVEKVQATIAQKSIVAPFAGRLGLRKVDVGQYVSPGLSLGTLTRLDPIFADFSVPEQDIDKIKPGKSVAIKVDAFAGSDFKGVIESVDARIDPATRNITVRASVDNADHRLLPGMYANVALDEGSPADVVTVPRTAVTFSLYGDSVFVVVPVPGNAGEAQAASAPAAPPSGTNAGKDEALTTERRFVRTGQVQRDRIAVLEGVKVGDRVVIQGQIKLIPNARVVIDPNASLKAPATMSKQ